jgi:hypothetical protein
MIKRRHLVFVGLVIFFAFLTGCVSEKSGVNLTNLEKKPSISPTSPSVITTIKTHVTTISVIKTSPTLRTSWFGLAHNETAYNRYPDNTSYDLSIGDVTLQKSASSGNMSTYMAKINITAKNGGPDPIQLIIAGGTFSDNLGDGCAYDMAKWCGITYFDKINPGESQTRTANVIFVSKRDYNDLLSKKFEYEINIEENNLVLNSGWSNRRNSWTLNIKNST